MKSFAFAIIIDDDVTNNLICENIILNTSLAKKVQSFSSQVQGYSFLEQCPQSEECPDLIFLDLRFPEEKIGWEFLDSIRGIIQKFNNQPDIYILTSSIAGRDIEKANNDPLVKGFISKPLTKEKLQTIF
jgi:two-component SAPR family response regulator